MGHFCIRLIELDAGSLQPGEERPQIADFEINCIERPASGWDCGRSRRRKSEIDAGQVGSLKLSSHAGDSAKCLSIPGLHPLDIRCKEVDMMTGDRSG